MTERNIILAAMRDAEVKAWEGLRGYKFWMFGYHAARWVNYNSLLPHGTRFRNPFAQLVKIADERIERLEQVMPMLEFNGAVQLSLLGSEGDGG